MVDAAALEPSLFVLRFLGARGRAEQGTRDPVNRFDPFPGEVWIANPPGFGQTSGRASPRDYLGDALAVFDALAQRAGGRPVWVQGQSLGTLAALFVAAEREPHWLVLRNVTPVGLIARHWLGGLAAAVDALLPPGFDALASARRAGADALFVTARGDRFARPELQARVLAAYRGQAQQLLVDCGHEDHVLPAADEARYRSRVAARLGALGLS